MSDDATKLSSDFAKYVVQVNILACIRAFKKFQNQSQIDSILED